MAWSVNIGRFSGSDFCPRISDHVVSGAIKEIGVAHPQLNPDPI